MNNNSPKYNRTLHLPWSEGASNDDKIAADVSTLLRHKVIITEKVDGSNTSLEATGCFARTHAGPPTHASFDGLKALHASLKHSIPDSYQIFGEWCFALHSILYDKLPSYFLMFAIRDLVAKEATWESWETVKLWANGLGLHTVPVLWEGIIKTEKEMREITTQLAQEPSNIGTEREGVVIRLADSFLDEDFSKYVMKWVRKNHVQTSEHWKNQEIIKNKLCKHSFSNPSNGFECDYCRHPSK